MIYAQRPDATACAEYDLWNNRMGRYVRRGSKGIALVDDSGDRPRLRYVFDISDTGTREHSRTPWLWTMNEEHTAPVMAMLERNYDVGGGDLAQQLADVAAGLAEEYWTDHRQDILYIVDGSFLEEYDEENIGMQFKSAATVSITYALMSRCGLEPEQYFSHEDFMAIFDFNTPATVGALGTAVSQINQQVLRQIGVTIQNYERAKSAERSATHGEQPDLHSERGLPDSRPAPERAADEALGQVRQDAQSVPEAATAYPVQPAADDREAVPAPSGDRRDGEPAVGADDAPTGGGGGRDGGAESRRPDGLGGPDKHLQGPGRGDSADGTYQQLTLNLFLSEADQIQNIDEAESVKAPSAFSFAQEDIDHVLRLGGNTDRQRERIVAAFEEQKSLSEIAAYLSTLYHGGNGIGGITTWYAGDGIHLSHGKTARYDQSAQVISWESAAQRIGQLLANGQFATNVELAEAAGYERSLLAEKLWYLYHDFSEEAREAGYLPSLANNPGGGFPEETPWLTQQLADPAFRQTLTEEYAAFWTAYQQDRNLLRFHYHKPREIWDSLQDLSRPRIAFASQRTEVPSVAQFITEDEINAALATGSSMAGGKGRIFAFFQQPHTDKERADFLKQEYGIGGRSHALSGAGGSWEDHDGKGLHYKKAGCPEVDFTWDRAAKQIGNLIAQGRYLTPQERAEYDKIQEEKALAEEDALETQQPNPAVWEYNGVKERHPEDIVLYQMGDFFEIYGEDAKIAAPLLHLTLITRAVPSRGRVEMCGIPASQLEQAVEQLRAEHGVTISAIPEDGKERQEYTMVPLGIEQARMPTIRELHERYKPMVVDAVLRDTAYGNACRNSDRENAVIEGNAAVRRAVLGSQELELIRLYSDIPEFQRRLHREVIDETYPLLSSREEPHYQVVVYHHFENGFDERMEYATVEEAEQAAQGYINGTMEPDGLAYDGAGVYDTIAKTWLRVYGTFPDERAQRETRAIAQGQDAGQISLLDVISEQQTSIPAAPVQEDGEESQEFHSETVEIYPAEENHLPYDVVVQTLRTNEPELPTPATEPEKTPEEILDEHPISIQVDGEWQTFPNARAAEEVASGDHQEDLRPSAENFHITDPHLGEGGPKEKFWRNIKAIATLKQIEQENRHATPEEQHLLSQYVGWGGLPDAFDPDKPAWAAEYSELKELLTPEEYAAARASTLNAHYTNPVVIQAIYEAVESMGFETGNILEPACGVGNFFGMLPESMAGSKLYGVELDSISGRIAQQLYPQADITVAGFETTDRRDFYDLAVGNVPFGQYQVNDKAYNKLHFNIHNYFFAKALDQVRPGGVVAFVTSRYTMDAKDSTVRRYLAQRAELLGAIRLPNDAFKKNAGTEVVSDIIFLQKRERPLEVAPDWTQTGILRVPAKSQDFVGEGGATEQASFSPQGGNGQAQSATTQDGFTINQYFLDHPEMVLGRQEPKSTAHGMDYTVNPIAGLERADQLHEAVQHIQGTYRAAAETDMEQAPLEDTLPADPTVRNYSYTVIGDQLYYRENNIMSKVTRNATADKRTKAMVELRDCVRELIDLELDPAATDGEIQEKQGELNRLYDAFNAQYGLISQRANRLAFDQDDGYYLLCALEVLDEDGNLERKADFFTKRTIKPHEAVTSVDTASEALAISIAEKACVDMDYMSALAGKTKDEIAADLKGVIFQVPGQTEQDGSPHYVTADEYLSGNVRRKLREAQQAVEQDPAFAVNVEALTAVQPKDLDASEIEVQLGATWISPEYIQQFMYETFETPYYNRRSIQVHYSTITAEWEISSKTSVSKDDVAAYTTYGTDRANAYRLLENALNLRDIRIYDTVEDPDGKERRVLNSKETTLAAQKQQAIRDAFKDWIWRDPERRQTLVRQYNEEMNSTRPREYDGSHITFGGMNPEITLREHQLGAIAHILYGGNTLLAHEVGAGKTFEMVAAAMESKRLGLSQKSLFVVPNHLTEQWASEFLRLYPSANILVTTNKDFEKSRRKKFCARIATGDYDAIIMGQSQFEKIPISQERQESLLQEQIDEITQGIAEAERSKGQQFTIKQLEHTRKSLVTRLEKLRAEDRKDDVVTYEELGVDRLFVDEAHNYKNLFLYTKMRNVAGLSTSDAQKSSDMFAKCRYMDEITGGRGVVFATGTPVSNSMTELYTMQRYLQYDRLRELGMIHFDCWASRFGETVTAMELAPEGTGYRMRTRFSKFFNLPELMNIFREVADIKTADQLHLPTPEVEYHNMVAQPTEQQKVMVKDLSDRASAIHSGSVDLSQDNMLKITSDGRKLGLDQRIINPFLPDWPGTKVNLCVENILRIWQEGAAGKLTQLIFCDISTPQNDKDGFSVYKDIRQKLIAQGIPAEQIAFIHDANTEVQKKNLFAKVRSGQVRVLLGSTGKMGAGTNVQDRLVALHDLDCPWRPGDLEQRKGRIVRQGNQNEKVDIYRYVTEGTFDAYLWQTVENKQKFISQIMTSKSPVRSCNDVDETALSFAEIKALCAGDPRIKERMELDVEVSKLKMLRAAHQSSLYRLQDFVTITGPAKIQEAQQIIDGLKADVATAATHPVPEEGFVGMTVQGQSFDKRALAGEALALAAKKVTSQEFQPVAEYRGFYVGAKVDFWTQELQVRLMGTLTYSWEMGSDGVGNVVRLDNMIKALPAQLAKAQARLEELQNQVEQARQKMDEPFPQEEEYQQKSARLQELSAELSIEEQNPSQPEPPAKSSRPSVLESLKRPVPPRSHEKKSKQYEQEVR